MIYFTKYNVSGFANFINHIYFLSIIDSDANPNSSVTLSIFHGFLSAQTLFLRHFAEVIGKC